MSNFRLHDDLFSPVRCDISTVDESSVTSEESSNDPLNFDEFSLTDAAKNKITLTKSITESPQENELKSKDENVINAESVSSCTPTLNKNLSVKLNAKKHSSKLKLEQIKGHKTTAIKKENVESQQKKQESLHGENTLDSHSPKSDTSDKLHKKKHRPTSLSLKNVTTKDSVKNTKKDSNQPLKYGSVNKEQKSKKKVTGSSSVSLESSDIKLKDSSVISTECKKNTSSSHIDKKKSNSNSVIQQAEELNVNPLHASYEASIKMMIHNSISVESAKIRQLMYMQQMSFYREMNKIKDNMEKQHFVTTERLFKVIEELMQMNATLRAGLSNAD